MCISHPKKPGIPPPPYVAKITVPQRGEKACRVNVCRSVCTATVSVLTYSVRVLSTGPKALRVMINRAPFLGVIDTNRGCYCQTLNVGELCLTKLVRGSGHHHSLHNWNRQSSSLQPVAHCSGGFDPCLPCFIFLALRNTLNPTCSETLLFCLSV